MRNHFTIAVFAILFLSTKIYAQGNTCSSAASFTVTASCTNTSFAINANGLEDPGASCVTAGSNYTDGWYKFVASATTTIIEISGANRNIGLSVHSGCPGTELAQIQGPQL